MIQNLRRLIFGVPAEDTAAAYNADHRQVRDEQMMYLPESRLTEQQIHGVGADGSTWEPWRVDADGEQWYRRTSNVVQGVEPKAGIVAFDAGDRDDELPEVDADDPWQPATNAADAVRNYGLRQAERKLQGRQAAFPLIEDRPVDDLDLGDFDDEEGAGDE